MMKVILLVGFALLTRQPACYAEQVVYSYTGSAFTTYAGTFTSTAETNITASITLAAPLGPNFTYTDLSPQSFSITDGFTTVTNLSPNVVAGVTVFYFRTDAAGNIDAWDMNVVQSTGGGDWLRLLTEGSADDSLACAGGAIGNNCSPLTGEATVRYSSGQPDWTQSNAVPEPSTLGMIAMGGVITLMLRLRRRSEA